MNREKKRFFVLLGIIVAALVIFLFAYAKYGSVPAATKEMSANTAAREQLLAQNLGLGCRFRWMHQHHIWAEEMIREYSGIKGFSATTLKDLEAEARRTRAEEQKIRSQFDSNISKLRDLGLVGEYSNQIIHEEPFGQPPDLDYHPAIPAAPKSPHFKANPSRIGLFYFPPRFTFRVSSR